VFVDKERPDPGPALLLLGALALLRSWSATAPPPAAWQAGETVPLRIEQLRGEEFRLLPGVGPALAARLEAARVAVGRLDPVDPHVSGVGPALRAKWAALRPPDTSALGGTSPLGAVLR
jgi:hypothetical protein